MVIVQLNGGLGNQLFQYATGRAIAYRNRVDLGLDLSIFAIHRLRQYRLNHFNIVASIVPPDALASLTRQKRQGILKRYAFLTRHGLPYDKHETLTEQYFHFDPGIVCAPGRVYLVGYWQSARYFTDIRDILCQELTVKHEPGAANRAISLLITQAESVSLHVRRGDYVSDPQTHRQHGVCSLGYYHAAVETMTQVVPQPHFFVFSDDIEWTQQNLNLDYPTTYVSHNGPEQDYEDLRLMSQCKHHIIANSSFSWWGAWLCTHSRKTVIAPQVWFNQADRDTRDLIPVSWIRL